MWLAIQRLVDMFIEFLIKHSDGKTTEDKIVRINAALVLATTVMLWAVIILGAMLVSAKLDLSEYKQNNTVVHDMLVGDDSIITSFVITNRELNNQVRELRADNIILIKDNYEMMGFNKELLKENIKFKEQCKK